MIIYRPLYLSLTLLLFGSAVGVVPYYDISQRNRDTIDHYIAAQAPAIKTMLVNSSPHPDSPADLNHHVEKKRQEMIGELQELHPRQSVLLHRFASRQTQEFRHLAKSATDPKEKEDYSQSAKIWGEDAVHHFKQFRDDPDLLDAAHDPMPINYGAPRVVRPSRKKMKN